MGFGEQIKENRNKKKITLTELAARMGVKQKYLSAIELGEMQPPQERVEHILSVIENWRKVGPFSFDKRDCKEFKRIRRNCKVTIDELAEITGISQQ